MDRKEELLIERAQQGDVSAFEGLVRKYDKQVLSLAFTMLCDTEDAKDAYQEVFLRAYRGIGKFRFQSDFSTWLYRIVVNYCISFRRKRSHAQFYSIEEQLEGEENWWTIVLTDTNKNPEEELINAELDFQIRQAVEQLPAQQKIVFVLRHYHDHKLSEIARILNCSEGTVKNYLFRATHKLKRLLQKYKDIGDDHESM